jgi:hypothetical protein
MTHTKDEALKLALEAADGLKCIARQVNELIEENKALKAALAQPAPVPLTDEHIELVAKWLETQAVTTPTNGPILANALRYVGAYGASMGLRLSRWYFNGVRTSEANIGIAGFDAKVDPARNNPYRTTPPAAQPAPVPLALWTEAQHERAYRNSPELHKDVKSLAAFKRVAKEVAAMYGITKGQP